MVNSVPTKPETSTPAWRRYLSMHGRIGRRTFLLRTALWFGCLLAGSLIFPVYHHLKGQTFHWLSPLNFLLLLSTFPICVWMVFATEAKRWQDVGLSPWWSILRFFLTLIPVFGILVFVGAYLFLVLAPGKRGSNRYGVDPRP